MSYELENNKIIKNKVSTYTRTRHSPLTTQDSQLKTLVELSMGKYQAVFFDLNGTLWDTRGCESYVLDVVVSRLLKHIPEVDREDVVFRFNAALLDMVCKNGLRERRSFAYYSRFLKVLQSYGMEDRALVRELSSHAQAVRRLSMRAFMPQGLHRLLKKLKRDDMMLGVIADGVPAVQRHVLNSLGLMNRFDHVLLAEVEGYRKPDVRIFKRAVKLAGTEPRNMLYVGDGLLTDVLGASRAGLKVAWLKREGRKIPERIPEPDHTINDLGEVQKLVAEE